MSRTPNATDGIAVSEPTALQSAALEAGKRALVGLEIETGLRNADGELVGSVELPAAPSPIDLLRAAYDTRERLNAETLESIAPAIAAAESAPEKFRAQMLATFAPEIESCARETATIHVFRALVAATDDSDAIERMMAAYPAPSVPANVTTLRVAASRAGSPSAVTYTTGTRLYQTGKTDGHIPAVAEVTAGGILYGGVTYPSLSAAAHAVRREQTGRLGPVDDLHLWSINGTKFWAVAVDTVK